MPTFRLTLLLAYGLAVLTAGLPARGFAWCLRDDGTLRVEATGADGRCVDADEHAGTAEVAYLPASGLAPCVDLTGVAGPLVGGSKSDAARLAPAAPVLVATPHLRVWLMTDPDTHQEAEPAIGPPLAGPDTTRIRKTVSLLV